MFLIEHRRLIAPLFVHRPVARRLLIGFTFLKIEQDLPLAVAQFWMPFNTTEIQNH
jgi:hypothetical protein